MLDLFLPQTTNAENNESKKYPVVVFVHGGAWGFGEKTQYYEVGKTIQSNNMICVVANYTLYPKGDVEHMKEDLFALLEWVVQNTSKFGGDTSNIILMGHSAGAHLLSLCLIEKVKLENSHDLQELWSWRLNNIKAFFGLAGVYDIVEHYKHETFRGVHDLSPMRPAMQGPSKFHEHSPTLLLQNFDDSSISHFSNFPAVILYHSDEDVTVPFR